TRRSCHITIDSSITGRALGERPVMGDEQQRQIVFVTQVPPGPAESVRESRHRHRLVSAMNSGFTAGAPAITTRRTARK
ncbi:hypothetical protein, partial [Mesorhizobium sp.]|uniref:hypothetical protein n=1 Tax=Mesorhizobium sp. TaxID=1871066 RepID=UPI0025C5FB52